MSLPAQHPPAPSGDAPPPGSLTGWPPAASALPEAEQAAAGVRTLLLLARGMAAAGRRVDLAGLEHMVGRLCARSLDLPAEEARRMRPALAALLVEIDALNAAMAPAT